ncbi:hypothetical protein BCR34DRAFT_604979 [Clohesyomyces aquaticus]|uniref:Uncharacterized protein n=1 Tax=Clohesyomyces aquaticus TaxID=1231657 RepID=A0A1Y1Z1F7_9PLEO|nr:hypothetical protein BCR34DRAFT_604979 [Clohesyomyces aquaticus]
MARQDYSTKGRGRARGHRGPSTRGVRYAYRPIPTGSGSPYHHRNPDLNGFRSNRIEHAYTAAHNAASTYNNPNSVPPSLRASHLAQRGTVQITTTYQDHSVNNVSHNVRGPHALGQGNVQNTAQYGDDVNRVPLGPRIPDFASGPRMQTNNPQSHYQNPFTTFLHTPNNNYFATPPPPALNISRSPTYAPAPAPRFPGRGMETNNPQSRYQNPFITPSPTSGNHPSAVARHAHAPALNRNRVPTATPIPAPVPAPSVAANPQLTTAPPPTRLPPGQFPIPEYPGRDTKPKKKMRMENKKPGPKSAMEKQGFFNKKFRAAVLGLRMPREKKKKKPDGLELVVR